MIPVTLGKARQVGLDLLVQEKNKADKSKDFCVASKNYLLDIDCLLAHVAGVSKTFIFSHPENEISQQQYNLFLELIEKRKKGWPVAYLIGKKEFFGYDFIVSPDVLIPKPDTEILVEKALELVEIIALDKKSKSSEKPGGNHIVKIADICTGSGCVAISVAKYLKENNKNIEFEIIATDISEKALNVAKENCRLNCCEINFFLGDLLEPLISKNEQFDLIISNPPYVPAKIAKELLLDGRNEPILALDGDCGETEDGTGIIRRLMEQLDRVLKIGGFVVLEAGEYNIESIQKILEQKRFTQVKIFKDLAGMNRVVMGKREH